MLTGLLVGVLWYYRQDAWELEQRQTAQKALARMQEQVLYQGALIQAKETGRAFPESVSPIWFGADLPMNTIVPGRQPWLDIAPPGDTADQPPDPVITRPGQAGFWYNPNRGLVRARVARRFTEDETLELYNQINNVGLKRLPIDHDISRTPHPCPLPETGTQPAPGGSPGSPTPAAPGAAPKDRPTLKHATESAHASADRP